jgi:predicted Na+-dependent transporter
MLTMGLSLTLAQVREPLKNTRFVVLALVANFVLIPVLAYAILWIIPLEQPLRNGLIVISTAAGAPVLPKLVQNAKGKLSFGVGLTVMLMMVSIVYLPVVLPLLLTGVHVNPWDIAQPLIVLMLVPLGIGLLLKSRAPGASKSLQRVTALTSNLAFLVLVVLTVLLNLSNMVSLITGGGLAALLLFFIGALIIGLLLGGRDPTVRSVMGLGTSTRDVSAAIAIVAQNFSGTPALPFVVVSGVVGLLILIPVAQWLGAHSQRAAPSPAISAE